ncbi:hypothetical protein SLEP1_g33376 [Rubroshorea leprosula]|uniref:Integrase catalytic domain-containing protein n=1 Tax=Rubroshorea leprosula TaxID=152421 RepID=A0AAV5KGK9_9ROSI|nr:hypothetical protein SLEP1_g33376 [Rubroshorea leprosula]
MGVELPDNKLKGEDRATPAEEVEEVQLDDNDPTKKTQMDTKLSFEEQAELIDFLKSNKDAFAWISTDMPSIPTSVAIGFVRRVDYCKWIANPVLIKKSNGKWRMCIDYTNLNEACLKDCHVLSSIDKLVEAALGNERLSPLDVYSRYHQVHMAPEDEVKISFYAGDEIYYYVMMPLGFKNAGATYQKMVTIVFRSQIGGNLEVYVDGIVVKSLKVVDHLTDLAETFNNLRTHRMRLNPTKYVFGVESGKFLRFIVSRRGIEINLEKIKVIKEMKPPRSIKAVQRLTGRVGALHKFISKSAKKCLPFFKILRFMAHKDEARKSKKFEWTSKCLTAFDELKSYLDSPPLLTKAKEGEILYLYLGISNAAISLVLVREVGKQQKLIYYANKVLQGVELCEHALKFNFEATNNMAKYEALLLGLRLAAELKVKSLQVYSDSQLIVNQVNSTCEVTDLTLVKYLAVVFKLKSQFERFQLTKKSRSKNEHANSLSKLASDSSSGLRSVFIEVLDEPSFQGLQVMEVSPYPETPSWIDPIKTYLRDGTVLVDKQEEMKLQRKASRYTLVDGVLYKRSYSFPLLHCLTPYEVEYASREMHEGVCGNHVGARTLAHKWGIDLLSPFIKGTGGVTHLVMAVDYFTKSVETRPLSSLTLRKIEDFVFSSIICRYGIPNQVVADNGRQFNFTSFKDFCSSYGIKLVFTSVYYPKANGMVESVNKAILEGIKLRLDQVKAKRADELNNVLWAY